LRVTHEGEGQQETPKVEPWVTDVLERIKRPAKRRRGRASKRTPERAVAIARNLRNGTYRDAASLAAGMSYSTLWEWMQDDPEIVAIVEEAEAVAETMYVSNIEVAARTTWQASAWMLERKYPAKYGRRDRSTIDVDAEALAEEVANELGVTKAEVIAEANAELVRHQERKRRETG
jgi:hypothetical protein